MNAIELEKAYNPKDFEDRIYNEWEKRGCFKPASDPASPLHDSYKKSTDGKKPLSIAVEELFEQKVRILNDDPDNKA